MLTDSAYFTAAHATLDHIERTVDEWLQADLIDIDIHRSGGMLQLTFPNRSQIIINTQPPLQELWMAAKGGGFHYQCEAGGEWHNTRDGTRFFDALSIHASLQAGCPLKF
jgi:CyaY protein